MELKKILTLIEMIEDGRYKPTEEVRAMSESQRARR